MKFRAYNIDYHEEATLDYWEKHQKNRKPVLCMSTTYERPMKRKSNDDQDDKVPVDGGHKKQATSHGVMDMIVTVTSNDVEIKDLNNSSAMDTEAMISNDHFVDNDAKKAATTKDISIDNAKDDGDETVVTSSATTKIQLFTRSELYNLIAAMNHSAATLRLTNEPWSEALRTKSRAPKHVPLPVLRPSVLNYTNKNALWLQIVGFSNNNSYEARLEHAVTLGRRSRTITTTTSTFQCNAILSGGSFSNIVVDRRLCRQQTTCRAIVPYQPPLAQVVYVAAQIVLALAALRCTKIESSAPIRDPLLEQEQGLCPIPEPCGQVEPLASPRKRKHCDQLNDFQISSDANQPNRDELKHLLTTSPANKPQFETRSFLSNADSHSRQVRMHDVVCTADDAEPQVMQAEPFMQEPNSLSEHKLKRERKRRKKERKALKKAKKNAKKRNHAADDEAELSSRKRDESHNRNETVDCTDPLGRQNNLEPSSFNPPPRRGLNEDAFYQTRENLAQTAAKHRESMEASLRVPFVKTTKAKPVNDIFAASLKRRILQPKEKTASAASTIQARPLGSHPRMIYAATGAHNDGKTTKETGEMMCSNFFQNQGSAKQFQAAAPNAEKGHGNIPVSKAETRSICSQLRASQQANLARSQDERVHMLPSQNIQEVGLLEKIRGAQQAQLERARVDKNGEQHNAHLGVYKSVSHVQEGNVVPLHAITGRSRPLAELNAVAAHLFPPRNNIERVAPKQTQPAAICNRSQEGNPPQPHLPAACLVRPISTEQHYSGWKSPQIHTASDAVLPRDEIVTQDLPIRILCSEHFLETWPDLVADLASGQWAAPQLINDSNNTPGFPSSMTARAGKQIELVDSLLVDRGEVDMELPGRIGVLVHTLSALTTEEVAKRVVLELAYLAAKARYRRIFVFLSCDIPTTPCILRRVVQLQTATWCETCPTSTFVQTVSPKSLSANLALAIINATQSVRGNPSMLSLIDLANDATSRARAEFLMRFAPMFSANGALECLHIFKKLSPSNQSFSLLLNSEKLQHDISSLATSDPPQATELTAQALSQLKDILSVNLQGF